MEEAIQKLRELTQKSFVKLTQRGNTSIRLALALAKKLGKTKVLIQDQGGWITYKQFPKKLGLQIIEIKTDYGLIDLKDLEQKAGSDLALLINSMAGYFAIENMEEISRICKKKDCLLINDVSGSIGTEAAKEGDIILGTFREGKPVNLGYGGFIATDNKEFFNFLKSDFDESKSKELLKRLEELPERLKKLNSIRKKVIADLKGFNIIHKNKEGINIIVKFNDEKTKEKIIDYCKNNNLEYTECPRYIRVNEKAISIEIKRISS
jgi:hypothetical protein